MNKSEILNILGPDARDVSIKNNLKEISDITSQLQDAKEHQVVFYNIREDGQALLMFLDRLKQSSPGMVIVNRVAEEMRHLDNVVMLPKKLFLKSQRRILNRLYPIATMPKLIGITGTNGKTTVANLAMQISTELGFAAVSIGTIGVKSLKENFDINLGATTPSYIELRKILYKCSHYQAIFFEVSSHALDQDRLYDLRLDCAIWTNFTQDHLDYHKTMDNYFIAKSKICFEYLKEGGKVIIPASEKGLQKRLKKYFSGIPIVMVKAKTLHDRGYRDMPMFYKAEFNQANLEVALHANELIWGEFSLFDISKIESPKGRFSCIEMKNGIAIVDYAHTPDALKNILKEIKKTFKEYKVTTIFGCGGDRDKGKRKQMGQIVDKYSDKIIVTSDNPRSENPLEIIDEILKGVKKKKNAKTVENRKMAIEQGLAEATEREIILIAGKGHEEYQEIKGVKIPFSDFDIINNYRKENA